MNKRIKAHPLMIADKIKPFLFVLILPLLKGVLQYILYQRISGVLSLEIAAFAVVMAIAVAGWLSFSLELEADRVIIRSGIIIKQVSYIDFNRISSLSFKRTPFDLILGSVSCSLNTEAGRVNKADFKFRLWRLDAELLQGSVYRVEEREKIRFSPLKIAFWAATTSSAFSGLLIGTPIINRIGDLLGVALYRMLFDEISTVSSKFSTYMPPIVNTVTMIFLLAYGVAFVYHFFRNLRFSLKIGKRTVKIENGIIFRRNSIFKKCAINNVCIEQTFLMRLTSRCTVFASVGGYGEGRSEKAVIAPCGRRNRFLKEFLPVFGCLKQVGEALRPLKAKGSLRRFLWMPIVIASADLALTITSVLVFPYFDRLIIFISAVILAIICYWAELCAFNYRQGSLSLGENICGVGSKGLRTRELYCEKERIGTVKLRETPADRRLNTCKVRLTVCSESADSVWVRNINKSAVTEKLEKIYKINICE